MHIQCLLFFIKKKKNQTIQFAFPLGNVSRHCFFPTGSIAKFILYVLLKEKSEFLSYLSVELVLVSVGNHPRKNQGLMHLVLYSLVPTEDHFISLYLTEIAQQESLPMEYETWRLQVAEEKPYLNCHFASQSCPFESIFHTGLQATNPVCLL